MPILNRVLDNFKLYLYERERSSATAEKYTRVVRDFLSFVKVFKRDEPAKVHAGGGKEPAETGADMVSETAAKGREMSCRRGVTKDMANAEGATKPYVNETDELHSREMEDVEIIEGAALGISEKEKMVAHPCGITKETVIAYKQQMQLNGYAVASVNAAIAGINCYLRYIGRPECCVRQLKMQRQIYRPQERELSRQEYMRLLETAKRQDRQRLYMILQTIAGTGIRISELRFFTIEAVRAGRVVVACKNKNRVVLVPKKLRAALLEYAKRAGVNRGMIFVTRNGRAVNRGNVWAEMKALCASARVQASKVFPHNLRKLFAAAFYSVDKDIAKLADVLGHSSINTTRIYVASSGREHLQRLDRLGLVV